MRRSVRRSLADLLPHGYSLDEADFRRRHRLLLLVLAVHVPALVVLGLVLRRPAEAVLLAAAVPGVFLLAGATLRRHRRVAAVAVTAGLVYCSAALVGLTGGLIEAHFHFFIIIGFIALYQDWVPFLFNVLFTVVSHGVGSIWQQADRRAGRRDGRAGARVVPRRDRPAGRARAGAVAAGGVTGVTGRSATGQPAIAARTCSP